MNGIIFFPPSQWNMETPSGHRNTYEHSLLLPLIRFILNIKKSFYYSTFFFTFQIFLRVFHYQVLSNHLALLCGRLSWPHFKWWFNTVESRAQLSTIQPSSIASSKTMLWNHFTNPDFSALCCGCSTSSCPHRWYKSEMYGYTSGGHHIHRIFLV